MMNRFTKKIFYLSELTIFTSNNYHFYLYLINDKYSPPPFFLVFILKNNNLIFIKFLNAGTLTSAPLPTFTNQVNN